MNRVEFIKGPQPATLGPNSLIGAAKFYYNEPDFENDGILRLEAGNHDAWRTSAIQNISLQDDVLALRLNGDWTQNGGFVDYTDASNGRKGGKTDHLTLRGKLLWQPMGNDDLRITLGAGYADNKNATSIIVDDLSGPDSNTPIIHDYSGIADLYTLNIDAKVNEQLTLHSITGYNTVKRSSDYDWKGEPGQDNFSERRAEQEVFTQEFRADYDADKWFFTAGLFFEDNSYESPSNYNVDYTDFGFPGFVDSAPFGYSLDSQSIAAFTSANYQATDKLSFEVGVRYMYEDQEVANWNGSSFVGSQSDTTDFVSPSFTALYQINDDLSTGINIARGYKSGGISIDTSFNNIPYDAESLWNYE